VKFENKNTKVKFGSGHTKDDFFVFYMPREIEINLDWTMQIIKIM
jgi:hypothetical protein